MDEIFSHQKHKPEMLKNIFVALLLVATTTFVNAQTLSKDSSITNLTVQLPGEWQAIGQWTFSAGPLDAEIEEVLLEFPTVFGSTFDWDDMYKIMILLNGNQTDVAYADNSMLLDVDEQALAGVIHTITIMADLRYANIQNGDQLRTTLSLFGEDGNNNPIQIIGVNGQTVTAHVVMPEISLYSEINVEEKTATVQGIIDSIFAEPNAHDGIFLNISLAQNVGYLDLINPDQNYVAAQKFITIPNQTGFLSETFSIEIDGRYNNGYFYLEPGTTYYYIAWYYDEGVNRYVVSSVDSFTLLPSQLIQIVDIEWEITCQGVYVEMPVSNFAYNGSVQIELRDEYGTTYNWEDYYIPGQTSQNIYFDAENLNPGSKYFVIINRTTFNGEIAEDWHMVRTVSRQWPEAWIRDNDVEVWGNNVTVTAGVEAQCADVITQWILYKYDSPTSASRIWTDGTINRGSQGDEFQFTLYDLEPGDYRLRLDAWNNYYEDEEESDDVHFAILPATGIAELEEGQIALYPNPAVESFTVRPYDLFTPHTTMITSSEGKQVLTVSSTTGAHVISVAELPAGTYLVTVAQEGSPKMMEKLVVLR